MNLNRHVVTRTWLYPALRDLYCAFVLGRDSAFEYPERFLEISALEKCLKSVLLFHRHRDYEQLPAEQGREKVTDIAKKDYGHKFRKMLKEIAALGTADIAGVLTTEFDGYPGDNLVDAVYEGYMEVRYPVAKMVADRFPRGEGVTHDPLRSSGITQFIYTICGLCVRLTPQEDATLVLQRLHVSFQHRGEELQRFVHVFVEPHCGRTLPPLPDK